VYDYAADAVFEMDESQFFDQSQLFLLAEQCTIYLNSVHIQIRHINFSIDLWN